MNSGKAPEDDSSDSDDESSPLSGSPQTPTRGISQVERDYEDGTLNLLDQTEPVFEQHTPLQSQVVNEDQKTQPASSSTVASKRQKPAFLSGSSVTPMQKQGTEPTEKKARLAKKGESSPATKALTDLVSTIAESSRKEPGEVELLMMSYAKRMEKLSPLKQGLLRLKFEEVCLQNTNNYYFSL